MFRTFRGGQSGAWRVTAMTAVTGEPLPSLPALSVTESDSVALPLASTPGSWQLVGVTSSLRYTERSEKQQLVSSQAGLGRTEATSAALIPIRKSQGWWDLTQDERRKIFEDKSRHIASSLRFLPAIARQLHHCRDLGGPFDFLTWFEFAPAHHALFDDLVGMLRQTEEWSYVDREVDIRVVKSVASA